MPMRRCASCLLSLATTLLGVAGTVGWLSGQGTWTQIFSHSVPMMFSTALAFTFSGTALFLTSFFTSPPRLRIPVLVLSGGTGLLGALWLFEYLSGVELGLAHLFSIQSGRMAPNTALGFVCISVYLLLQPFLAKHPNWTPALAVIVSVVINLGITALLGYALGIRVAYAWGNAIPMSLLASCALSLLGMAAWIQLPRAPGANAERSDRVVAAHPVIASFTILLVTITLWQAAQHDEMIPEVILVSGAIISVLFGFVLHLQKVTRAMALRAVRDLHTEKEMAAIRRSQQARLANTSRLTALGEMAGGIAHEVNTPLGIISLNTSNAKMIIENQEFPAKLDLVGILDTIESTVFRIAKIIHGLKTFARDGSRDPFKRECIKQILDDTLLLCSQKLNSASIRVELSEIPSNLGIECRSNQISQVILSLIHNSREAIENRVEKWIRIEVADQGEQIEIRVIDSGQGIPENVRSRIMEPFFTTKAIGKGVGLGLSMAKGILIEHQGDLDFDSDRPNTCFVIRLPKKQSPGASLHQAA